MSKHKLKCPVTEKWVDGWDDLHLMTLVGRGVPHRMADDQKMADALDLEPDRMPTTKRLAAHIAEVVVADEVVDLHLLYVGNLSWDVDNVALETLFTEQRKVVDAKLPPPPVLTKYELHRIARMQENDAVYKSLGVPSLVSSMREAAAVKNLKNL
ncbi:hypothetical protein POM88_050506 [Heracleum sosnowskyi]|uniref:Uncharacterized protein n=1 Tax=Heracleum sosnowskyi TaxID=360622 RepID=A0AAD8H097_9APIA|nr:hypothetical protein POM88_050506 [Heracleum sosnowskyi]